MAAVSAATCWMTERICSGCSSFSPHRLRSDGSSLARRRPSVRITGLGSISRTYRQIVSCSTPSSSETGLVRLRAMPAVPGDAHSPRSHSAKRYQHGSPLRAPRPTVCVSRLLSGCVASGHRRSNGAWPQPVPHGSVRSRESMPTASPVLLHQRDNGVISKSHRSETLKQVLYVRLALQSGILQK